MAKEIGRELRGITLLRLLVLAAGVLVVGLAWEYAKPRGDDARAERSEPEPEEVWSRQTSHSAGQVPGERPQRGSLDAKIDREFKTITPASAAELLKAIDAHEKDVFERSRLSTKVLIALSLAGFPDEAWSLVNPGYGEIRGFQIRALLHQPGISLENRFKYFDSLDDPGDRADGVSALISSLRPEQIASLDTKRFRIGSAGEKIAVQSAFSMMLESLHGSDPERFATDARQMVTHAMKMAAAGEIGYDNLRRILSAYHFDDGFGTWDMLHEAGLAEAPTRDIRKNIITKMLRKDADRAFGVIMDGGGPDGNNPYLSIAVAEFYGIDSIGANKWLTDKVVDYPSAIRDRIYGEVAVVALKGGEAEAARGWAGLIQDATVRKQIQNQLLENQKSP